MRKLVILLAALVAFILPADMLAAQAKVTLRLAWWGNPTRDERTLKVVDMYQKLNPNVTIEPETINWAGYWDRINTQVASNSMPDVMQHDYAYLLQFVGRNLMADLTPYVQSKTINLTGVDETYLSGGRVGGKLYGVSLGTNAVSMVYDPAVLKNASIPEPKSTWTWADFEKMAQQVYTSTKVQTMPIFVPDPRVGFDNWIRQTGKSFFAADGKSMGFTDTTLLQEFFELQLRLLYAGILVKPEVAFLTTTPQEAPFAKGNSWVDFVWSNGVVSTQAAANRPIKVVLMPKITTGYVRPGTYLKPSMFFSIPQQSKVGTEAAKFINFFLTNQDANKVLLGERGVPIIPAVRDTVKNALDPYSSMIFDYIGLVGNKNASPIDPPDPAAAGEILKLLRDITQEVLYGKTASSEGAKKFLNQANEILKK
jgi:multiple sugar transport system substrate-binding protein